jgi:hypothetical protein
MHPTWRVSSSVTVGQHLNDTPRRYERPFPWISAPKDWWGCLALAAWNNAKVDRRVCLWAAMHRYLQQKIYRAILIITIILQERTTTNFKKSFRSHAQEISYFTTENICAYICLYVSEFSTKWGDPRSCKRKITMCCTTPNFAWGFQKTKANLVTLSIWSLINVTDTFKMIISTEHCFSQ